MRIIDGIIGTFGRSLDSAGPGSANPMYHYSSSLPRSSTSNDDEHQLIARYAARLALENRQNQTASNPHNSLKNGKNALVGDPTQGQRELIAQLETRNKEILLQINKLRLQQEADQLAHESPHLMTELRALRQRKGELEGHLGQLQDSR